MNCAAAFDALHAKSLVIGDVNQGNVLVSDQGTVYLIDCDSFQVSGHNRIYSCEVGVPHFTPPELQGKSFKGVTRTANHDLFGLGILVFHLLCMGRHPFAGRYLGSGDLPIEKAISDFRFAYGRNSAALQMASPPHTLALAAVMPKLAELFDRAFGRGSERAKARPPASEWYAVLREFRASFGSCEREVGHKYPRSLSSCPWCQLQQAGAPNFFVSVTVRAFTASAIQSTLDIRAIWTQIEAVPSPSLSVSSLIPSTARFKVIPTPIPSHVQQTSGVSSELGRTIVGCLAGCVIPIPLLYLDVLVVLSSLVVLFSVTSLLVSGIWWLNLQLTSGFAQELRIRRQSLTMQRTRQLGVVKSVELRLSELLSLFEITRTSLKSTKRQLDDLKPQYEAELQSLRVDSQRRQRDSYLQRLFISDYKIEKIGDGRVALLASYGIETAFDIEYDRVRSINTFGHKTTSCLVQWKREMESKFKFDPSQAVSPVENQALITKYIQLKGNCESEILKGLARLKQIKLDEQKLLSEFKANIATAVHKVAQAESDLSVMSKS